MQALRRQAFDGEGGCILLWLLPATFFVAGPHVTVNVFFRDCPLPRPFASTCCFPGVAVSGMVTWVANPPLTSVCTTASFVVPETESIKVSSTFSAPPKPDPLTRTTVPGGPNLGFNAIAARKGTPQSVPSQVQVSPR